ncbi:MAG: carbon starvation protein A [Candidatus Hydrogenedentota bacterium]|nr:MAG: carbon starvation protein A [Candidatus Hydrogenedentota bacterium]
MQVLAYLFVALALYVIASRFYGSRLAQTFGIDPKRLTPAARINDGRDFVPTRTPVVFGHHFATIAGAMPIIGPTLALVYGYLPVLIWIVFGAIFIGAVHDFSALFASVREEGRSVSEIARKAMGNTGFTLFIIFTIIMILLVTSLFLKATAVALTSVWPVEKLGLPPDQTLLKTQTDSDGVVLGRVGGIASTSVIIITSIAPLLGYLLYKRNAKVKYVFVLATFVCVFSVFVGFHIPVTLEPTTWMIILTLYVTVAAGIPVWIILQPRDFTNVQLLYGGLTILLIGLVAGGFSGALSFVAPASNVAEGVGNIGFVWPMLCITVACGAISGFHALAAGGTTSKQVCDERAVKNIGYNAMLLESALAVGVVLALASSLNFSDYKAIVWPAIEGQKANPILAFSLAVGHLLNSALHLPTVVGTIFGILMVEGFVVTTLDSAVRINRYLFEELWSIVLKNPPKIMRSYWFNSGLAAALMFVMAYYNAFVTNALVFGSANQLLAALTLFSIAVWFMNYGKVAWMVILPGIFMMFTTIASLLILPELLIRKHAYMLLVMDIALLGLSIGVIYVAAKTFREKWREIKRAEAGIVPEFLETKR